MTQQFSFCLDRPGLAGVRFLVEREALPDNGDLESAFLDGIYDLVRHQSGVPCAQTIYREASGGANTLAVLRNPQIVLDARLPGRIAAALAAIPAGANWSIAGAGGLGLHDRRHLALYASQVPAIPIAPGLQPLLDVMPDLYLLDAEFARTALGASDILPDQALETVLAVEGYLADRTALFLPGLSAGINGTLMTRELALMTEELTARFGARLAGQTVQTLSGNVEIAAEAARAPKPTQSLAEAIDAAVADLSPAFSLSIIVRTQFTRAHLLERLLASISRARVPEVQLEVILSSDADPALAVQEARRLGEAFVNLTIRLQHNPTVLHSRVDNLTGGLSAALGDYACFIDDDDYVDLFAFRNIRTACFGARRPLIVTATQLHAEEWQSTPSGRWVLAASRPHDRHASDGWRDMFSGVNRLPVCAVLFPRERLAARLAAHKIEHDLSEDYALFLLALTDPHLPEIVEIPETFCHVSIRGQENSVTMPDRRPWVRDITAHLQDLTGNDAVAGPGVWQLLTQSSASDATLQSTNADLEQSLRRAEADLALARRENRRLRDQALKLTETGT